MKLVDIGTDNLPLSEQRIVRLINIICSSAVIITFTTSFLMQAFSSYNLKTLLFSVYAIICFLLPLIINYFKKPKWSKWALVYIFNQVMLIIFGTNPYSTSSWIVIICLQALYVALFSEKKTILILSAMTTVFVFIYIYHQSLPSHVSSVLYNNNQIRSKHYIYFFTTSAGVLAISYFIKSNLITHQQKLETALDEKDILLKEVHHRVKNNLQVVSSLFNIQERQLLPEQIGTKDVINKAQSRIQSMALVHQLLCDSSNLKTILLEDYIANLVQHISNIYHSLSEHTTISITTDNSTIELEQAIPIGLIINEALTNSFKYAFANGSHSPEITISFNQHVDDHYLLEISDNGVGSPTLKQESPSNGVGLHLIKDMVKQLKGEHIIDSKDGFKHSITFRS